MLAAAEITALAHGWSGLALAYASVQAPMMAIGPGGKRQQQDPKQQCRTTDPTHRQAPQDWFLA